MTVQFVQPRFGFNSNIYLVGSGTEAVLIDAGSGADPEVPGQIAGLLNGRKLRAVLLTHCHSDHAGGVPAIVAQFGCPVFIGSEDLPPLEAADGAVVSPVGLLSVPPLKLHPLYDGETIDLGDHRLQVICTPGHTAGSVCFWDQITSALFSGDTVFRSGYGRCDFPTGSVSAMRNSLFRLRKVNIKTLYPGHDEMAEDGTFCVSRAIQMLDGC